MLPLMSLFFGVTSCFHGSARGFSDKAEVTAAVANFHSQLRISLRAMQFVQADICIDVN